jgi:hypothetical protein
MARLEVFVDGRPYSVPVGSEVWLLIDQLPPDAQLAIKSGLAYFTDAFGNQLGEGGALFDGQRLGIAYFA